MAVIINNSTKSKADKGRQLLTQIERSYGVSWCLGGVTMERERVAGSCNSSPMEIIMLSGEKIDGKVVSKPRVEWTVNEIFAANCNKKAKNALVAALSGTQFSHIQHIPSAKLAWDKLRVVHEGDDQVRTLKLQMVLAQFEELRMSETENISEFYDRVEIITNEAMSLG
ncbi:unnamed protein product [Prunus armeniaca]